MSDLWDLEQYNGGLAEKYCKEKGYDVNTHEKFKVGETITFFTGYNDDIRAKAAIKGIDGNDLYVYNDCYWFPIQDDDKRKIEKCQNV